MPTPTAPSAPASQRALIIGSGFGGLSLGIRLQSMGFTTTIVEALDVPGGRARVRKDQGYTFDMGPTVITVPHFIEELMQLEKGVHGLDEPDFPAALLEEGARVREGGGRCVGRARVRGNFGGAHVRVLEAGAQPVDPLDGHVGRRIAKAKGAPELQGI